MKAAVSDQQRVQETDEDRVIREIGDTAGLVFALDRMQANPAAAVKCPTKKCKAFGTALGVHASGGWLICGMCEHRVGCGREDVIRYEEGLRAEALLRDPDPVMVAAGTPDPALEA